MPLVNRRVRNRTHGGVGGRRGQPRLLPDYVTNYEKKNDFLLIEIFEKFFNPKDGHLKRVAILF